MGLFGSREERREKVVAKMQQKRMKYLQENKIEDLYTDANKEAIDTIIDMSQNKGSIPQFQDQGVKTIYTEQLVLERQNWLTARQNERLIQQNEEIIQLLKNLNK